MNTFSDSRVDWHSLSRPPYWFTVLFVALPGDATVWQPDTTNLPCILLFLRFVLLICVLSILLFLRFLFLIWVLIIPLIDWYYVRLNGLLVLFNLLRILSDHYSAIRQSSDRLNEQLFLIN